MVLISYLYAESSSSLISEKFKTGSEIRVSETSKDSIEISEVLIKSE